MTIFYVFYNFAHWKWPLACFPVRNFSLIIFKHDKDSYCIMISDDFDYGGSASPF